MFKKIDKTKEFEFFIIGKEDEETLSEDLFEGFLDYVITQNEFMLKMAEIIDRSIMDDEQIEEIERLVTDKLEENKNIRKILDDDFNEKDLVEFIENNSSLNIGLREVK